MTQMRQSIPVIGVGALTEFLAPRISLLIFSAVLVAGILTATPVLFGRQRELSPAATTRTLPHGQPGS